MFCMDCISISYKTAPDEARHKIYFDEERKRELLKRAKGKLSFCVLLHTCNRTEMYFDGDKEEGLSLFVSFCGGVDDVKKYVMRYEGKKAVKHLFFVCGGLDSMLLGETEILGQTREAFLLAESCGTLNADAEMIFQAALGGGKSVKSETLLTRTPLSYATLAANIVFADKKKEKKVFIIGVTGKLGRDVMKNLIAKEGIELYGSVRSHNAMFSESVSSDRIRLADYRNRYDVIAECDYVISVTSCPHFTVTAGELERRGISGKHFIDLASPPDIDGRVRERNSLATMEDLAAWAERNRQIKREEFASAQEILEEKMEKLYKNMAYRSVVAYLPLLKEKFGEEIEKRLLRAKAENTASDFEGFIRLLTGILKEEE